MKKGQSLVEVVIALSLLAVSLVGLLTLAMNIVAYSLSMKIRTQAIGLAQEGVESIRSRGGCYYHQQMLKSGTNVISSTYPFPNTSPYAGFTRVITVETPDPDEFHLPSGTNYDNNDFYSVTSRVTWHLPGTPDQEVTLYGLMGKNY